MRKYLIRLIKFLIKMKAFSLSCLLLIVTFSLILSHSVKFPGSENVQCKPPQSLNRGFFQVNYSENEFRFPNPISWHVHVTYMLTNKEDINRAAAVREKARFHFKDHLGPDCPNRYDNKNLCMIIDHPLDITLGPFPIGEWSVWVPNSYLNLLLSWFAQNRNGLSVLFHPNTGCEYEDHSDWAFWVGSKWNLDMSIFNKGEQTNEFDHIPGDIENPVCLTSGLNCGSPDFEGVFLACCGGLVCECGDKCTCQKK